MTQKQDPLQIVGDFLIRFYHEEPDDTKASMKALKAMIGLFDYEWEVASAFKELLEMALPSGTLRDMVRIKANRHARSDEEAREFLEFTYKDNDLDMAVNFKDLSD
jgi:hypothetical protein